MVREFPEFSNEIVVGERTHGKRMTKLGKEEIRERLINSIHKERNVNFDGIDGDLEKATNVDEVMVVLTNLLRAVKQHGMLSIYFSCFQGKVLKKLKDVSSKARFKELIQLKEISYSHAQFLIKLVELTNEYDKLAYSSLTLRFIKSYFKTIVIVSNNKEVFKL